MPQSGLRLTVWQKMVLNFESFASASQVLEFSPGATPYDYAILGGWTQSLVLARWTPYQLSHMASTILDS